MKKAKLAASLIAVSMAATTLLTGCNNGSSESGSNNSSSSTSNSASGSGDSNSSAPEAPKLEYKDGTVLRTAIGYNKANTGIAFDAETVGKGENGTLTLADGKTYQAKDLKPAWAELETRLKIKFEDHYQGNDSTKEFEYWKEKMDQIDIVKATAKQLSDNGESLFVDLSQYLDSMPNFKAYLEKNPIVRLSITSSTMGSNKGAIYFAPYFDGADDIERMPLMRTDWVAKLLNGKEGEKFAADKSGKTATPAYQPYMPTSGKVEVDIVTADGKGTAKVTKDYGKYGNIIEKMNAAGSMSGVDAVNMLRDYIDQTYGGYYKPENRADLFIGQDAAWDADELVALLRCVVANADTLNGGTAIKGIFAREEGKTERKLDMYRLAGHLFGARGLESRQDFLYVGNDNKMHDARMEEDTYIALERMNTLAKEGLISDQYISLSGDGKAGNKAGDYQKNDTGFMSYDYSQTQTTYNEKGMDEGEEFRAVMVPVAGWKTGADNTVTYMRFTESWRSVKSDGFGISKSGVGDDKDKLNACLKMFDYAYSKEGQILMSYGPDAFIKTKADGSYETFNFNGEEWPVIADATYKELWDRESGNYTNYARRYLGSTLGFLKSQSFEYQCTTAAGRKGGTILSNAIALGVIKHPELAMATNPWYTSVPTVLPMTDADRETIDGATELGSNGKFNLKTGYNLFIEIIKGGYAGTGNTETTSREATLKAITETWKGSAVLDAYNQCWDDAKKYYNGN